MTVRLNITMDAKLYKRLKKDIPPRGISAFIEGAVRSRLRPDRKTLEAAYAAASRDASRDEVAKDWEATEVEGWPE